MKESLFILKKIRNKKNCTFSGEKYVKFFHPTSLVPSRLPQQVIYHLSKSQLKQDESLINNLHQNRTTDSKVTAINAVFHQKSYTVDLSLPIFSKFQLWCQISQASSKILCCNFNHQSSNLQLITLPKRYLTSKSIHWI